MAILAIVITTTIAMFAERAKRLREASETIIAYQALSNEAEHWRRMDFTAIDDPAQQKFQSTDLSVLTPLAPYSTSVKVDTPQADVRNVTLTIRWATNREAHLAIARASTGGSGLW